jgi:hypothetical protein
MIGRMTESSANQNVTVMLYERPAVAGYWLPLLRSQSRPLDY